MIGNGTTIPYSTACGLVRFDQTFGGTIRSGALINQQFTAPGVLSPFVSTGTDPVTGSAQVRIGNGSSLDASLKASLRSHQLFGRGFTTLDGREIPGVQIQQTATERSLFCQ